MAANKSAKKPENLVEPDRAAAESSTTATSKKEWSDDVITWKPGAERPMVIRELPGQTPGLDHLSSGVSGCAPQAAIYQKTNMLLEALRPTISGQI
jgi:hypothetical protein